MAYCVVRTDKMHGTEVGADLVAVKYNDGTGYAAIENGNVVALDAYLGNDLWKAVKPTAKQALGKVALIANPEIFVDYEHPLDQYINEAGKEIRGYLLRQGDIFSITADGIDGTLGLGDDDNAYVEIQAGTKLKAVEAATNAVAELIAIDVVGNYTYYVLRVL